MSNQFETIYGNNVQAVIVEKDGKIEYFNDAADRLIPNITTLSPEQIFPPEIINHDSDRFMADAEINGKMLGVDVTTLSGCKVYAIIQPQPQGHDDWTNIFSAISYELNNYLSVLKMSSGLLLPYVENLENPRLNRYASMIYHSYYNIQRISNNLNDFSDYVHNCMILNRTSFDLAACCGNIIDSVRHLVTNRDVELRFDSDCDSLTVYADRPKLEKLILNLLSNSLLNTPDSGAVILKLLSADEQFILKVSDNGQGMSPAVLHNAWCQYRTDRQPSDQRYGVGLGLPVVHAIAKQHNGSVMLESKPGQGTCVTVSIPMVQPENALFMDSITEYDHYNLQQLLTELSGVISSEKYTQKYMD